jgi:leucyl-tRNA synthetase
MNGPLHIGHGFTATRVDVYARFKRMQGYNVLWPWAWHWTGQPIVAAAERLKRGDPAMIREFKEIDRVPDEVIERFTDPVFMAHYYTEQSREAVKRMGFSIDWRREFHTTSLEPTFDRFIRWQYERLREGGYVVKGTHPVVWCPRDKSPTGDHDRLEGEGVTWEEYTLVKFSMGEVYLPAATFRPETIFGVTNLWINPDATYVEAEVDGERWIISQEAAEKLGEQNRQVKVARQLKGADLIGRYCQEPAEGRKVLILPGWFVDPKAGSGVVYSVPAHAPFDWVALRDLQENPKLLEGFDLDHDTIRAIKPISMIRVEGFGEYPAIEIVDKMGIKDQRDPALEEATQTIYRREFHRGVMKENTGPFAGQPVARVKEGVIRWLGERNGADRMYDLPRPVICRCGTPCIVKVLEDQWFLRYSDPEWKARVKELIDRAKIYPEEARQWFLDVVDWLKEWPCARRIGLGSPLPWNPEWIVETLSDSTVYMAFYTIRKHIVEHNIRAEQLTLEVFDYIFYGRGDPGELASQTGIDRKVLEAMRQEFEYWYPVDLRNSAKELLPNHLSFFLFQHAALFPPDKWPRAVGVNGMMMLEGRKMSKSKGNIITLRDAIDRYGADVVRATLVSSAEGMDDADWRAKNAEDFARRIAFLPRFYRRLLEDSVTRPPNLVDRWLLSTLQRRVEEVTSALEVLKTRTAFQQAFYAVWNDLRRYQRRVDRPNREVVQRVLDTWCRLLAPFIPFTAEELYHQLGGEGFVTEARWPRVDRAVLDEEAEVAEWLLDALSEDVASVLKLFKPAKGELHIYVADEEQRALMAQVIEARIRGGDPRQVLREVLAQLPKDERRTVAATLERMIKLVNGFGLDLAEKLHRFGIPDETRLLSEAAPYLAKELGLRVKVWRTRDKGLYDPKGRAGNALPLKPAIYVE